MARWEACRRSRERYADAIGKAIIPDLGEIELQKLKPLHVKHWMAKLLGTRSGCTVANIFLVLNGALKEAVKLDLVARNVAAAVTAPKIKTADELKAVLAALAGSRLLPIASLALATGMRRGELLALRSQEQTLATAPLKVDAFAGADCSRRSQVQATEERPTAAAPLPSRPSAVAMLDRHRREATRIAAATRHGQARRGRLGVLQS